MNTSLKSASDTETSANMVHLLVEVPPVLEIENLSKVNCSLHLKLPELLITTLFWLIDDICFTFI